MDDEPESSSGRPRLRKAATAPLLPLAGLTTHPQSYPGDEAGLLRKLLKRRSSGAMQLPQVPLSSAQLRKNRDKLVALLEEGQLSALGEGPTQSLRESMPGDDELLPAAVEELPVTEGRITIYCTANSYDLAGLREHLESSGHSCSDFPEALYTEYVRRDGQVAGDICFFNFGVTCFWNLSPHQEKSILQQALKEFEERKLSSAHMESEVFAFRLVPYSTPSIQNDIITLSPTMADLHLMKLSISFALAQSTRLTVLEERALAIAEVTRKLPIALAKEGKVRISDKAVAQLMGRVFIEQAALNLLGSVLDTPDYFWQVKGDHLKYAYDKVFDYLEMEDRIEVLNARLAVLHELLDMLRLQGQAQHSDFLEVIIILLICVDVVILLAQVAATLGLIGAGEGDAPTGLRGWGALAALLGKNWT